MTQAEHFAASKARRDRRLERARLSRLHPISSSEMARLSAEAVAAGRITKIAAGYPEGFGARFRKRIIMTHSHSLPPANATPLSEYSKISARMRAVRDQMYADRIPVGIPTIAGITTIREGGMSWRECGAALGIAHSVVYNFAKKHGLLGIKPVEGRGELTDAEIAVIDDAAAQWISPSSPTGPILKPLLTATCRRRV